MSELAEKSNNSSRQSIESNKVRCVVQQCLKAKLCIRLANKEESIEPEHVQIDRGVVLFVCFMKGAEKNDVEKLVKSVLNVKLSESINDSNKNVSILDLPGSILIIPQASLGGKMKGKMIQYHDNVNKDKGLELYNFFISLCKKYTNENENWSKQANACKVESGTYGIKQIYSTETNGPFLHIIEF